MSAEPAVAEIARISAQKDYYKILGVERDAGEGEIKKKYRRLALLLHPDKCSVEGAEESFKKVSSAYACLSQSSSRQTYDLSGSDAEPRFGGGGHQPDLDAFFREFMAAHGGEDAFGRGGGGGAGPFVFHTFDLGGGGGRGARGGAGPFFQARTNSSTTSSTWMFVVGVLLLVVYLVYAFFSMIVYHIRRVVLIAVVVWGSSFLPAQHRSGVRNALFLVALLIPTEMLML